MIKTKCDLRDYLKVEITISRNIKNLIFPPPNYRFVYYLRKFEYHFNNRKKIWHLPFLLWYYYWYYIYSLKTGLSIPKNVCEKGLTIYHFGSIVINGKSKIGENCCIMNNVNIGANQGSDKAPIIGRDVYIGPGVVIFGDIVIADGCYIGANAVVNKSITNKNSVVVGVPARIIKVDPVHWWEKNRLSR